MERYCLILRLSERSGRDAEDLEKRVKGGN
jgi:hypothetical protein